MGYRFQDQCYETKQEFLNALAQSCYKAGGSGGLTSYYVTCTSNVDTITVQGYSLNAGTAQTAWSYTPQTVACDFSPPYTNADVIQVSWLVVGVWVVAWGIKKMAEVLKK
jgi:hypothetical protein